MKIPILPAMGSFSSDPSLDPDYALSSAGTQLTPTLASYASTPVRDYSRARLRAGAPKYEVVPRENSFHVRKKI